MSTSGQDFDYSVRDGVRLAGSRGGGEGSKPARILEVRFDPSLETEQRILRAVRQMLRRPGKCADAR